MGKENGLTQSLNYGRMGLDMADKTTEIRQGVDPFANVGKPGILKNLSSERRVDIMNRIKPGSAFTKEQLTGVATYQNDRMRRDAAKLKSQQIARVEMPIAAIHAGLGAKIRVTDLNITKEVEIKRSTDKSSLSIAHSRNEIPGITKKN